MNEIYGMKWSMYAALALGILGIVFSFLANSQAVLLDGAFNIISAVTAFFSIRIMKLLERPMSERLPVGYGALEPFYVMLRGLILTLLTGYIVISNVIILINGGTSLELNMIIIYLGLSLLANFIVYFKIRKFASDENSEMLILEKQNWLINTSITSGIALSFLLVFLFQDSFLKPIVPYIDQIIVSIVGLATIKIPFTAFRSGLKELLLLGVDPDWIEKYKRIIEKKLSKEDVKEWRVYFLKSGRKLWISLFVMPRNKQISSNYSDQLSDMVSTELSKEIPIFNVDVIITNKINR